jgi:steroid delta-isomerase-like uncharacterized protein
MNETDRNLGSRWFEEVWNKGRREAVAEMMGPDAVLHEGGTDSVGPDGFHPFFDRLNAALSEIRVMVHDTIAEEDRICIRWSCSGKHTGEGLGIPVTGRSFEITGMSILRVAEGRIVEGWQNWDMLGMLQQVQGHDPAPTYVAVA